MLHHRGMATFLNTRFHGFARVPDQARCGVLIVHGLADYSARFDAIAGDLAKRDIASFAFDLTGHGAYESLSADPSARTHIERFDQFINETADGWNHVRSAHPQLPLFVWGHSMGAIVATLAVAHGLPDLRGVITSSAPIDSFAGARKLMVPIVTALASLTPRLRLSTAIRAEQLSTVLSVGEAYARDPLVPTTASIRLLAELAHASARVLEVAPTLQNPWLVVHGEADDIAPLSGSQRLLDRLASADKRIEIYRGLRHELQNEREPERSQLIDLFCQWMHQRSVS